MADLADLSALDRSLLHVFVAGPGYGEGLALALPDAGWVFIDGCRVQADFPLLAIFERWSQPGEPVDGVVLTHPHEDHASGIRLLIERARPRWVAAGTPPGREALLFQTVPDPSAARTSYDQQRSRVVVDTIWAMRRFWEANPGGLLGLVDGAALPTSSARVALTVRAPTRDDLAPALERAAQTRQLPRDANRFSAVLEVALGATTMVLGGDLPRYATAADRTAGRALAGGWDDVMARHGHLGAHRCLKVPHHGSSEAEHPGLMTSEPGRPWLITPYNRGAGLPSVERADGLPMLIDRNREVLLTAIPASLEQQPVWQAPGVVRLADLADRARERQAHRFADPGVVLGPIEPLEPLDPVWCAAFDDQGRLRGRWRGSRALSVVA